MHNHRFQHLRRGNDRNAACVGKIDDTLLNRRHPFERHFDAQIAARNHDHVGNGKNIFDILDRFRFFDLGDNGSCRIVEFGLEKIAEVSNVFCAPDKAQGQRIDSDGLNRKPNDFLIVIGKRGNPKDRCRKINSLVAFENPSRPDSRDKFRFGDDGL